ncbi:MAG: hypothetical protein J7513_03960 [Solirubrobacteraceae bacterium]|nr:hypothetical protein [Solirubrobacteraceae bacterium]
MITHDPQRDDTFEDRLGAELRAFVAERPAPVAAAPVTKRRRATRPAIALSAIATTAAAGALLIPGGSPAYAVEGNDDGTVTIEIKDLADASGLEEDLADAGVKAVVDYLSPGKVCKDGRFDPAQIRTPIRQGFSSDGTGSLTVRPADFAKGTTLVITSAIGTHSTLTTIGVAKGAVGACVPVDAKLPELPPLPATKDGKLHEVKRGIAPGEGVPPAGEGDVIVQGSSAKGEHDGPSTSVSGTASGGMPEGGASLESADR